MLIPAPYPKPAKFNPPAIITSDLFKRLMPYSSAKNREEWAPVYEEHCIPWGVDTAERQAGFFCQLAQESGSLNYVKELASGQAYEYRSDLGNTAAGDGPKFKGHGHMQITGKNNHLYAARYFGIPEEDMLKDPEILTRKPYAALCAFLFWRTCMYSKPFDLTPLADLGDVTATTKRINGGYTHLKERQEFYNHMLPILRAQGAIDDKTRPVVVDPSGKLEVIKPDVNVVNDAGGPPKKSFMSMFSGFFKK